MTLIVNLKNKKNNKQYNNTKNVEKYKYQRYKIFSLNQNKTSFINKKMNKILHLKLKNNHNQ